MRNAPTCTRQRSITRFESPARHVYACAASEKLTTFADAARDDPAFAKELPKFLAAVWRLFNAYEIAGCIASRKPAFDSFCSYAELVDWS